jgi:hypothetical protein
MGDKAFEDRVREALTSREPFLGHPLLPIALRDSKSRTERISTYLELDFVRFLEQYGVRAGMRGLSEVLRRLAIIGAQAEGYAFDEPEGAKK